MGANGAKRFHKSPRVAIAFTPRIFARLSNEAAARGIPFAGVVRERIALSFRETIVLRACFACGYKFPEKLGKYGCPNCNGEGL
jgi:hypothetical protein